MHKMDANCVIMLILKSQSLFVLCCSVTKYFIIRNTQDLVFDLSNEKLTADVVIAFVWILSAYNTKRCSQNVFFFFYSKHKQSKR